MNKAPAFGADQRYKLSLRFQMFDVFNRHSPGDPNTQISSPDFGTVPAYNLVDRPGPRVGQFAARFTF